MRRRAHFDGTQRDFALYMGSAGRRRIRAMVRVGAGSARRTAPAAEATSIILDANRDAGLVNVRVSPRMVYVDASRPDLVKPFTLNTFTAMIEGVRS